MDRGRIELPTEACKATVIPFNYQPKHGVPPRTRTLTDGFGDRGAAITPEIPDTLLRMCVLKHSKILRLPVLKECFNTI